MLDVVGVELLELQACPDDALREVQGLVVEAAADVLEDVESGSGALLLEALRRGVSES